MEGTVKNVNRVKLKSILIKSIIIFVSIVFLLQITKILFDINYYELVENKRSQLHTVAQKIDGKLASDLFTLQLLANDGNLIDASQSQMDRKFQEIMKLGFSSVWVYDIEKKIVMKSDEQTKRKTPGESIGIEDALKGVETIKGKINYNEPDKSMIVFSVPLFNKEGSIQGVAVADMKIKYIRDMLPAKCAAEGEYFFILDNAGVYIAPTVFENNNLEVDRQKILNNKYDHKKPNEFLKKIFVHRVEESYLTVNLEHTAWTVVEVIPIAMVSKSLGYALMQWVTFLSLLFLSILLGWTLFYQERKHTKEIERIRVDRLRTATNVAASVAHEIKNPLTSLRGFLQLMKRRQKDVKENEEYFAIMLDEIDRIELLSNQFCMLSRPDNKKNYKYLDITEILHEIYTLVNQRAVEKQVEIRLHIEESSEINLYQIWGNRNQLKQVILNLVCNAIEAIENGGKVEISCIRQKDKIVIQVADNGIGIDKENLEKLGQPFYTTKENGTGLGLLITFELVKQHGGQVDIASEVGKGTAFTITLPFAKKPEQ